MTIDKEDVSALVKELQVNAARLGLTWILSMATVEDPTVPTVTFDSDLTATPVPVVPIIATPTVGERVYVASIPPAGNYIIGRAPLPDPAQFGSCVYCPQNPGSGTTTSASFANLPGNPSCTVTKAYDDTDLLVDARISTQSTLANTSVELAVLVNGTDYVIWRMVHTPANTHDAYGGIIPITGLVAGSYSVVGRWRRPAGGGTITMDSNDWFNMFVREVTPI